MKRYSTQHRLTHMVSALLIGSAAYLFLGNTPLRSFAATPVDAATTIQEDAPHFAQYVPLHPEDGADPTPQRWEELMANWTAWYGNSGGYGVNANSPIIPGTKIWPSPASKAVWPKGSDQASLNKYITRTIMYKDQLTGETIAPTQIQQVHYGEIMIIDLVTGENLGYAIPDANGNIPNKPVTPHKSDGWYPLSDVTFAAVTSPDLSSKGYGAPTLQTVVAKATTSQDENTTITVLYPHHQTEDTKTKTVQQIIHYRYQNGQQATKNHVAQLTFTQRTITDDVTHTTMYDSWKASTTDRFDSVTSPTINGFTASQTQTAPVLGITATSADLEVTVTYKPVPRRQVSVPNHPSLTPPTTTVTTSVPNSATPPAKPNNTKYQTLPKTGEQQINLLSLLGIALFAIESFILVSSPSRRANEHH